MTIVEIEESDRPLAGELEWRGRAACAKVDPDLFTGPFGLNGVRRAKGVCQGCPVRLNCLEFALETAETFGIWGGLTEGERRRLQMRRSVGSLIDRVPAYKGCI